MGVPYKCETPKGSRVIKGHIKSWAKEGVGVRGRKGWKPFIGRWEMFGKQRLPCYTGKFLR